MKIFITGCAGFIGFHLTYTLLSKRDVEIFGIDNLNDYYDINLKKNRLEILKKFDKRFIFEEADINNEITIMDYIKKSDIVINLAAQAGVRYSFKNPYAYIKSNINGFYNVLDKCQKFNKKLIYASSSSVYGKNEIPWSEDQNVNSPLSLYASTKISNELLAESYFNMYKNLTLIGLRFFTVWGTYGRPDMSIFLWIDSILKNKPIQLFNYGNHYRDYTYIDDIVDGIIACIDKDFEPCSEIFNLGNNKPVKIGDVVSFISKYTKIEPKIEYLSIQPGDIERTCANIDKAKKELGFNPKIEIEDKIEEVINWHKSYMRMDNG